MKANFLFVAATVAALMPASAWADGPKAVDIKRVVPVDAHMAMYARNNPERDYERAYLAEAFRTFEEEHIAQRLIDIVTSRMPEDKLATAKSKVEELKTALEPIRREMLLGAEEVVVAQVLEVPANQTLVAVRMSSKDADDCERGLRQTLELIGRWTDGKVTVENSRVKDATVTALVMPAKVPLQPAIGRLNDIVLISTSVGLLRRGLEQLQDESATSKFDDARLKEALTRLPQPEDSLLFFDGKQLFQKLHGIGDFITAQAKNNEQAARMARFFDRVINDTAIFDYTVTVEYSEPGQQHKVTFGKLADDANEKLLGRVINQGKPIEDWQRWVPKEASSYSLTRGVNLHQLYDGVVKLVREEFPESQQALDKWAALQDKFAVNLDRDILQSFSGESVRVRMPVKAADGTSHQESVAALKCQNPDKIRELLSRAIEGLNSIPAVQAQQLKLEECKDLAGFQKLRGAIFQMFGATPVIGFHDGWMILGSSEQAAKMLIAVRAGQAESIDGAASFKQFGLDGSKPVCSVCFRDLGAEVREVAHVIDKIGVMAPMLIGMAAANAKPEDLKPVQEAIGVLPGLAKVIRKLDFYEHNLTVNRPGPSPGTYLEESVTEVRMPSGDKQPQ